MTGGKDEKWGKGRNAGKVKGAKERRPWNAGEIIYDTRRKEGWRIKRRKKQRWMDRRRRLVTSSGAALLNMHFREGRGWGLHTEDRPKGSEANAQWPRASAMGICTSECLRSAGHVAQTRPS
jgi:hypothetical protein